MRIVTEKKNPWGDLKEHFAFPITIYGDKFKLFEETEENTGMAFPTRLDGAEYGRVLILLKDESAMEAMYAQLGMIRESILMTLTALDEARKLQRSEDAKTE